MAGSAAEFAASAGQLAAAAKAAESDAQAAKIAEQANVSLAQAKRAMAAAAQEAAAAARAEAAAQKQAAQESAAAAREAAKLAAQWARERAAREKQEAKDAATAQRQAAKEQGDAAKAAAKEQKKQLDEFAKAMKKAHKEAEDAAKRTAEAQKQAAQDWHDSGALMTSPLQMVNKVLDDTLGKLGPEGQAAVMAFGLATAAAAALSAAIVGGMGMAIAATEKFTQKLAVFSALAGSESAGKATLAMVSKLSERLPYSSGQLSEWAQAMMRAGMSGKGLESAVKAIAAAAAINPEGGAEAARGALEALSGGGAEAAKFLKSIQTEGRAAERKLRDMGLTMADLGGKTAVAKMTAGDLTKALEKALVRKGAGPLEAMMNTWPVIIDKARTGFSSLFGGLASSVEPFMKSVREMFGMFNKGSPTMAAIRPVITSVFSTLFSWATKAVGVVHGAFQQIVIAALKARIAAQPVVVAVRALWAELQKAAAATGLFSGKSATLGAVLAIVKSWLVGAFLGGIAVVTGFVRVLTFMVSAATSIISKVRAIFKMPLPSLASAAANMVSSFVAGITGRIGAVVGAMSGMGQAAKSALFGALGIHSPSRVAIEAAGNVTGTFADKVDDGTADTRRAFDGMVKVPGPSKGASGGAGGAGARLEGLLDRLCNVLEASPGVREVVQMALAEALQEGA